MKTNNANTASTPYFVDDGALTAEQVNFLAVNIDNLTEPEAALLLAKLQQESI